MYKRIIILLPLVVSAAMLNGCAAVDLVGDTGEMLWDLPGCLFLAC